jgi:hypothetical protein
MNSFTIPPFLTPMTRPASQIGLQDYGVLLTTNPPKYEGSESHN